MLWGEGAVIKSRKIQWLMDACKLFIAYIIGNIAAMGKSKREVWLISERKGEARDNGYHLFKYIRETYPSQEVYYVIDSRSTDLKAVASYGNCIYYDSFKHYLYYVMAAKLVCAHLGSAVPDSPICWKAESLGFIKKKRAFIQHGITKETLPQLKYGSTKAALFVCGAQPEYEFVNATFGYPDRAVKYLGLSRFDELHGFTTKKQIVVMPTWRQWFGFTPAQGRSQEEYRNFTESEYYKRFQSLLNNKLLDVILEKNDVRLIFYPHHEIQGFLNAFSTASSNIVIADEKDYDVQQLLKESALLITDYSSVAFDVAYMRKPVIYYQFDTDMYFKKHYPKGYFEYERDGFGPVIRDEKELVEAIHATVFNGLVNDKKYLSRAKRFFPLFDRNNCERNYQAIMEI